MGFSEARTFPGRYTHACVRCIYAVVNKFFHGACAEWKSLAEKRDFARAQERFALAARPAARKYIRGGAANANELGQSGLFGKSCENCRRGFTGARKRRGGCARARTVFQELVLEGTALGFVLGCTDDCYEISGGDDWLDFGVVYNILWGWLV